MFHRFHPARARYIYQNRCREVSGNQELGGCEMAKAGGSELFSSAEIAFLAKEELIMIMPKIRMAELKFLHVRKTPIHPAPHMH